MLATESCACVNRRILCICKHGWDKYTYVWQSCTQAILLIVHNYALFSIVQVMTKYFSHRTTKVQSHCEVVSNKCLGSGCNTRTHITTPHLFSNTPDQSIKEHRKSANKKRYFTLKFISLEQSESRVKVQPKNSSDERRFTHQFTTSLFPQF